MIEKSAGLPFTAFLLAGGLGLRLRTVVFDRPKPMASIGDTPFLEILIDSLATKGVREFVLLTGFRGEMIEDFFHRRKRDGISVKYSREAVPLGTGGAVKNAERFATDPTLLVNGDTFFDADLGALYEFHMGKQAQVTLSLYEVEDISRYGSVCIDNNSRVTGFVEKKQAGGRGLINAGLSLVSADFISRLPEGTYSMEQDIFTKILGENGMFGLCQDKPFFDIGTPESYEAFNCFIRRFFRRI
ncbi:MAG: NTP transferase domain-containing protein [Desulfomonile tiedjei]|uniref:NTP transferase domain-containing protein n=1 Tax=Desulfomonile tiedjei TaxID=2358 RepID=A0A9D6V143_9BACT|nr:NTP transferase domain-containing protein [Desulfomonile tiedjei]